MEGVHYLVVKRGASFNEKLDDAQVSPCAGIVQWRIALYIG